jgi:hypothetical protein
MTDPIQNALRRLREHAEDKKAPDSIEGKLLASYRVHHHSRKRRWMWVPAAVAASLALAISWRLGSPTAIQAPEPQHSAAKPPATPEVSVSKQPEPVVSAKAAAKAKPRVRRRSTAQVAKAPQRAQEFYQIPYTPELGDYDSGRVVRVNMPGASVRSLGFPVMLDRVQADVFVGDDGVARAIRVVSGSGLNFRR